MYFYLLPFEDSEYFKFGISNWPTIRINCHELNYKVKIDRKKELLLYSWNPKEIRDFELQIKRTYFKYKLPEDHALWAKEGSSEILHKDCIDEVYYDILRALENRINHICLTINGNLIYKEGNYEVIRNCILTKADYSAMKVLKELKAKRLSLQTG